MSRAERIEWEDGESTESTVTPTYVGFRRHKLDTVASSDKRIFWCAGVVQACPDQGHVRVNVKLGKKIYIYHRR